jgi:hypothetical protein
MAALEDIVDVGRGKRIFVISDNFQNPDPIGGRIKVRIRQKLFIIAMLAHGVSLWMSHDT